MLELAYSITVAARLASLSGSLVEVAFKGFIIMNGSKLLERKAGSALSGDDADEAILPIFLGLALLMEDARKRALRVRIGGLGNFDFFLYIQSIIPASTT